MMRRTPENVLLALLRRLLGRWTGPPPPPQPVKPNAAGFTHLQSSNWVWNPANILIPLDNSCYQGEDGSVS